MWIFIVATILCFWFAYQAAKPEIMEQERNRERYREEDRYIKKAEFRKKLIAQMEYKNKLRKMAEMEDKTPLFNEFLAGYKEYLKGRCGIYGQYN